MTPSDEIVESAPSRIEPSGVPLPPTDGRKEATYRVGSLVYSRAALLWLVWEMLGGVICFEMIDQVSSKLLPVTLKDMQASNATVGLLISGLPMILGMTLVPVVGARSDRFRSRFGRRIPFLFVFAPLVGLFLVLVGQADSLGDRLGALVGLSSTATAAFVILAVAAVSFQLFNRLTTTVYQYLVRDVIPGELLGRFWGLARTFGAAAGFLLTRYGLGWADANRALAYGLVGGCYAVVFFLLCRRVKESAYPPPSPRPATSSFGTGARVYCRECFSHPYYVLIYVSQLLYTMSATCVHTFVVFLARDMGMSLDAFGKTMSWTLALGLALYLPLGYLADRVHPIRLQLASLLALPVISALSFFAIHSETTFLIWTLLWWFAHLAYLSSNAPLVPLLLPAEKFGQFYSALYIFGLLGEFSGAYLGGQFLDWTEDYRYIYIWNALLNASTLLVMLVVYVGWKHFGGAKAYQPPPYAS